MDEFMESTSGGPKLPALKFAKVGDTHTGVVTEVTKLQDKDPAGNVKTYDNGDPRWVFVFTLDTPTGASNLWVRGQMVKAIREAAEKHPSKRLSVPPSASATQATEKRNRLHLTHPSSTPPKSNQQRTTPRRKCGEPHRPTLCWGVDAGRSLACPA